MKRLVIIGASGHGKVVADIARKSGYCEIAFLDDNEAVKTCDGYGDKIRYFSKENGGVSSALNCGIRHMTGEYFSWLSHDDVYTKDKVQIQVERLSAYNESTIAYCGSIFIDENSEMISSKTQTFPDGTLNTLESLMYVMQHSMGGCAFLIHRSVFDKVGLFDENLRYCQDTFMWWNIFLKDYSLCFCNQVGVLSRLHGKQLTQTGSALFHHDAQYIGQCVTERFAQVSTPGCNVLFEYAKRQAKYANPGVVALCIRFGKEYQLLHWNQVLEIRCLQAYGAIRPYLRKIYYYVFRGIKTK